MRQNLHTHTPCCDGKNTAEEMVLAALEQGLDSLGLSGHSPLEGECWAMEEAAVGRYRREVLALREKYAGKMEVFLGLEQDILSPLPEEPWDYLIGSVHMLEREGERFSVDESAETFRRGVERWFGGDPLAFAEAYYRQVGYDYCDYQQMIPFLILLDKDLQVREVRQMGPEFLCKEERNYKLFTDILMGTSGKWDKIVDGEDWYQYLCVIRHY